VGLGATGLSWVAAEASRNREIREGAGGFNGGGKSVKGRFNIFVEPFSNFEVVSFGSREIPLAKIGSPAAAVDADDAWRCHEMIPESGLFFVVLSVSITLFVIHGFRAKASDRDVSVIFEIVIL
jgi:hypothetical protein